MPTIKCPSAEPTPAIRMRPLAALALALLAAGIGGLAHAQVPAEFAAGRILVMPRAGLPEAALDKILKEKGAGKARRVGKTELRIVELPAGQERAAVERLARHPHVKFAELDARLAQAMVPNDPYFGSQWHHAKIGSAGAWDLSQGAGVTIAVLDTGVDGAHPELTSRMLPGWNFYDNNSNTSDNNGHGTAVAGTLAAATNNGLGVAALAGQARIMPLRISDPNGWAYASTVAQALTFAADNGARVANISFDGMANNTTVRSAAQYFKSKGGLVVVAAGNSGTDMGIGATTAMIPVSATDASDKLSSFSSFGTYVAMSAPGENIWTTKSGGAYWYCWGTSFASPITAGVVALMMSANAGLSSSEIEGLLYSTATDLGASGRDSQYGYGRVNAAAAVKAAASTMSMTDTQAPTADIVSPYGSSTVSGLVPVDVTASDNMGVARVDLMVNGVVIASDTSLPYAFSWDSSRAASGMNSLKAVAVDGAGNVGQSAVIQVNVANTIVADTTPPTLSIQNPSNGSRVSGNEAVTVLASDNAGSDGLSQSLYIDGTRVAASVGGNLSYRWNTRKVAPGVHIIKAMAADAAGNSSMVTISVTR